MSSPVPDAFMLPPNLESGPSMLDLVRLSPEVVFPPGGQELYRRIATLTELSEGQEVLDAACGRGVTTSFLAHSAGVSCVGVDPDEKLVREAEERAREDGLEGRVSFDTARLDDLPYRDGTFDVAIGELGLGGEVRSVPQLEQRLREASRLGLGHGIVPHMGGHIPKLGGMALLEVRRLSQALAAV